MGENPLRIQDIKDCADIGECLEAQTHACRGQRTGINGKNKYFTNNKQ